MGTPLADYRGADHRPAHRIDLGQPHNQNAETRAATLGGDLDGFRRGPVPAA
jgi:hypothetical protein